MRPQDHEHFWDLYERKVRVSIERACQYTSRTKTDSTMDIQDMIAWIDTRVWTMLENESFPTFHDNPTPEQAIDRLVKHAPTLARWAYLGLCRSHFRRLENRANYTGSMSRAQRLSMASSVDSKLENREELDDAISSLRKSLSAKDKQKLAASWIDEEDRSRVALVLGATRREDDVMITKATTGNMNKNTIEQMRSRARKRALEVLNESKKLPFIMICGLMILGISMSSNESLAGEQTGGRRGTAMTHSSIIEMSSDLIAQPNEVDGEQTGGRGPKP